jgi:hypothetical protein
MMPAIDARERLRAFDTVTVSHAEAELTRMGLRSIARMAGFLHGMVVFFKHAGGVVP